VGVAVGGVWKGEKGGDVISGAAGRVSFSGRGGRARMLDISFSGRGGGGPLSLMGGA
jgi:hypothetical protein